MFEIIAALFGKKSIRILQFVFLLTVLVLPGGAFLACRRIGVFLFFVAVVVLSLSVPAWLRLFSSPFYLLISIVVLVPVYLISFFYGYKARLNLLCLNIKKNIWVAGGYALWACVLFFGLLYSEVWLGYKIYIVPSKSMMPSLIPGDFVFVDVWVTQRAPLSSGEIIVFKHVSEQKKMVFIKRVSHIAGDTFRGAVLQTGTIAVLGDNRDASFDSRIFGPVLESSVEGVAQWVAFSLTSDGVVRRQRTAMLL